LATYYFLSVVVDGVNRKKKRGERKEKGKIIRKRGRREGGGEKPVS